MNNYRTQRLLYSEFKSSVSHQPQGEILIFAPLMDWPCMLEQLFEVLVIHTSIVCGLKKHLSYSLNLSQSGESILHLSVNVYNRV